MSEHLRHLARHARVAALVHAERRPAGAGRRRRALPADPGRARRRARRLHPRVRPVPGRRLLRHDARAPAPASSSGCAVATVLPRRPRARARRGLALPGRAVPAGHGVPVHRRADQRQRLQGVPRRDARRALGRLRRDRPRPDPRRRPPARPVRRLRRPRRRRPTCASWPAGSPPPPRCRSCSTRPSRPVLEAGLEMLGGRAVDQLGQLRGRRRADSRMRRIMPIVARARCRGGRADHRRGGPGPHRRVEGRDRRAADRRPHRHVGDAGRRHPRRLPHLPDRHRPGGDAPRRASRRSRRSASSSAATRTSRPPSACRTSPSGSTPPPGMVLNSVFLPSASRPGWTRRSCTPRRSCRWRGSRTSSAQVALDLVYDRARRRRTRTTRCSASSSCSRASTPRRCGRPGRGAGRPAAVRAAGAADHRRRAAPGWRPTSTRRWRRGRRWRSSTTRCSPA